MAPGTEDKIMHANVQIRDTQIMMSDGRCEGEVAKVRWLLADAERLAGRSG